MRQAKSGDTVRIHYRGTLVDGTEFDSSAQAGPVKVMLGKGEILPAVEAALIGMREGEDKAVTLQPQDAFGPHEADLVHVVERSRIPAEVQLTVGGVLHASDNSGNEIRLRVIHFDDDKVTLDANHPLAGQTVTFHLKLLGFVE